MDTQKLIVVGVDDSADAVRALEWAVAEARVHHDRVLLVHAWQYPAVGISDYAGDPLPVFGYHELEKVAADVLTRAVEVINGLDATVAVDTRLVQGHPGEVLVEASDGARLLIVGSRGLGGFKGMLMGSISNTVAHHARCPVVIVPPADR